MPPRFACTPEHEYHEVLLANGNNGRADTAREVMAPFNNGILQPTFNG
jgi:hypothetical protein